MNEFSGQVVAQAIAFILFLTILRLFAWKPVLGFLEERRSRIENELDRVDQMAREAQERQEELNARLEKIEEEARARIQEAVAEGRRLSEEIADGARADAREIRAHAKEMAEIELAKAMRQVKDAVVRMTMTATERLLRETMDDGRHRQMVRRFLDDLEKS